MKPERLKACLDTIRWGPATLAQILEVRPGIVEGWLGGRTDIPAGVASWLEALCSPTKRRNECGQPCSMTGSWLGAMQCAGPNTSLSILTGCSAA